MQLVSLAVDMISEPEGRATQTGQEGSKACHLALREAQEGNIRDGNTTDHTGKTPLVQQMVHIGGRANTCRISDHEDIDMMEWNRLVHW
jgi:hypothetical protein